MSKVTKVSIGADPGYTNDASLVTKTPSKGVTGDNVVVGPWQTGINTARTTVVVLRVSVSGTPTVSTNPTTGVVSLTASGTGTTAFLLCEIDTPNPNNWSVNLVTSGGTTYKFQKGTGGAGRKS